MCSKKGDISGSPVSNFFNLFFKLEELNDSPVDSFSKTGAIVTHNAT